MLRTSFERTDRRAVRLVAGTTLLLLALAVSAVGMAPATAQEDAGTPVEIKASTLYVSPATGAVPPTLTSSVPPAAVCVVVPESCPETPEGVPSRGDVATGIGEVKDQAVDAPVQPVPADSAAVSFLGGVPRYETALKFDAPAVPEGHDVMRFELTFPQSQPTYDASSPAFRRAVLAAFEAISSKDPADFVTGMVKALDEDPIDTSKQLAFEACPFLDEFTPGGAPQSSDRGEMPHHDGPDGDPEPAVDCTYGGNGVYDEEADVWRVDLAFTAQAWADGELDNHGILLRPIGAPNLAFGDADTSTNAQLVLDITEVTAAMETAEAFDPSDFGDFDEAGVDDLDSPAAADDFAGDEFAGDDFAGEAPSFDSGSDVGAPLDSPEFPETATEDVPLADAPAVADGLGGEGTELDTQATRPAGSAPQTPWWVWTLAPLLIGGAYLTGSAVLAPAPALAAASGGGGGALTRLLAKHTTATTVPTQI
jgi:hypothetical protein